jgi:hypothetical protein
MYSSDSNHPAKPHQPNRLMSAGGRPCIRGHAEGGGNRFLSCWAVGPPPQCRGGGAGSEHVPKAMSCGVPSKAVGRLWQS